MSQSHIRTAIHASATAAETASPHMTCALLRQLLHCGCQALWPKSPLLTPCNAPRHLPLAHVHAYNGLHVRIRAYVRPCAVDLTGKDNMRALPGRVLSNLLAHKVAQVGPQASHEGRPRGDAVGVEGVSIYHFSFPHSLSSCLP